MAPGPSPSLSPWTWLPASRGDSERRVWDSILHSGRARWPGREALSAGGARAEAQALEERQVLGTGVWVGLEIPCRVSQ